MSQATIENLALDETDKADARSPNGKESTPIEQMVRRTDAHQMTRRIVYTCTPTTPKGFIWVTYLAGTEGRPYFRCPGCGEWFWFEWSWDAQRLGWDDDTSEITAEQTAFYPCPHCTHPIREVERLALLQFPLWIHAGEKVAACSVDEARAAGPFDEARVMPDGTAWRAVGERKATRTVSFWWNRLTSPFTTLGYLAAAVRNAREEETKRHSVCLYDMAMPYTGRILDLSELKPEMILDHIRFSDYRSGRHGRMPFVYDPNRICVTGGIDIGQRELYAVFDAWEVDADGFLLNSWRLGFLIPHTYPNPADPGAIYRGLEDVRAMLMRGWRDANGRDFLANAIAIDTGYQHGKKRSSGQRIVPADYHVFRFCKNYGLSTWRPVDGRETLGGDGIVRRDLNERQRCYCWAVDTDLAKCEIHEQLKTQPGKPGFWYLPTDTPASYARGLCAEQRVTEFDEYNRAKAEWVPVDIFNHPLDAQVYSWAIARDLGVKPPRLIEPEMKKEK